MSWKLYEAYRLRKGIDLFAFVRDIRPKLENLISRRLGLLEQYVREHREQYGLVGKNDGEVRGYIERMFREQFGKAEQNTFGMDVSIAIRELRGSYFLIPISNGYMDRVLTPVLSNHRHLRDYHYQNSSDRPYNITARDYNKRGRDWSEMEGQNDINWHNMLVLDLLNPESLWRLFPDNARMIRGYQRKYARKFGRKS